MTNRRDVSSSMDSVDYGPIEREMMDDSFSSCSHQLAIVAGCMAEALFIKNPRYFQLFCVCLLYFTVIQSMLLVWKTGGGKSAVILALALLRGGITLVVVPQDLALTNRTKLIGTIMGLPASI